MLHMLEMINRNKTDGLSKQPTKPKEKKLTEQICSICGEKILSAYKRTICDTKECKKEYHRKRQLVFKEKNKSPLVFCQSCGRAVNRGNTVKKKHRYLVCKWCYEKQQANA